MDIRTRLTEILRIRMDVFYIMEIRMGFKFSEYDIIGPEPNGDITIILDYDKFVVYNIPL